MWAIIVRMYFIQPLVQVYVDVHMKIFLRT